MLDPPSDLEQVATALADQDGYSTGGWPTRSLL
jgi:hypothetical protein